MREYKNLKVSKETIEHYLNSAEERIESAEILFKSKSFRDAVSRAYYAFLDAARAALLTKNKTAKTHAGVLMLFGLEFGKTGEIPQEFFKFYKKVKKVREEADYELMRKFTEKEAKEAIENAEKFVKHIEKLIKGRIKNKKNHEQSKT